MHKARADHLIIRMPPEAEASKGGVLLPGDAGKTKGYGRIVSVGPRVEDETLRPGLIGVFDMNGVRPCTMARHEKDHYVAITEDMLFSTIQPSYLGTLALPVPEPLSEQEVAANAEQDEEAEALHGGLCEEPQEDGQEVPAA